MKMPSLFGRITQRWRKAPTQASAEAAFEAGRHAEAVAIFRSLADEGHVRAQYFLGLCYDTGAGVPRNPVLAERHYQTAANAGDVTAAVRLGELYLTGLEASEILSSGAAGVLAATDRPSVLKQLFPQGLSVDPDPVAALHWNRFAAERGNANAQARLGHQYAVGAGTRVDLDAAHVWFKAAADQSHVGGELGLGLLHAGHYGAFREPEAAVSWLERAARQKNATARLALALLLDDTPGDEAREERITKLYTAAARAGLPYAMYRLGERHRLGDGTAVDASAAETWLRRAASKGIVVAHVSLVRLLSGLPDADPASAAAACREAAELDDPQAQYLMGLLCLEGRGTPRDASEAAKWFALAAGQGVAGASERLGALYAEGHGVEKDPARARECFEQAVASGDREARVQLATLRLNGLGGPADVDGALADYRTAASEGSALACLQLGILAAEGRHRPQDFVDSARWYAAADALGSPEGAFNLANLYLQGLGVEADEARARERLEVAAERGCLPALWQLIGDGTGSDAPRWLGLAAERGDETAAAVLYDRLVAAPAEARDALGESLKRAAGAGNTAAMCGVALALESGALGAIDLKAARMWMTRAADAGSGYAREWLTAKDAAATA